MRGAVMRVAAMMLMAGAMTPAVAAQAQGKGQAASESAAREGAEAWAAGNYARALALWRPLAARNDADAQYNLAQAYRLGRGVAVDEAVARDWYLKAAQRGHVQAQANYGLMLFQSGDRRGALPWLSKAAERGDARAQYVAGTALFNGDVAGKDWVRAYALMTRAAAAGLPQARTSLAEMDRYVPPNQRQQGTALARDMERSVLLAQADTPSATVSAAAPAAAVPAIAPIATTSGGSGAAAPVAPITSKASAAALRRQRAAEMKQAAVAASPRPTTSAPLSRSAPPVSQAIRPPAAPAPAVSAGGGWRVQVGAYSTEAAANAAWAGIVRKVPGLVLRPQMIRVGTVTRLQAGPLASRAAAGQACARIAATGTPCFPVPAR